MYISILCLYEDDMYSIEVASLMCLRPAHHVGHEVAPPQVELDALLRLRAAAVVGEDLLATDIDVPCS